jgi:hypothetical protein
MFHGENHREIQKTIVAYLLVNAKNETQLKKKNVTLTKLSKTQLTSVKEGIIPFSLYLLSSKSNSQLDEQFN